MKLTVCVLFLGCLVLAAAFPAPREEDLVGDLEDLVDGLEELGVEMEVDMAKRGLRDYRNCIRTECHMYTAGDDDWANCRDTKCAAFKP
ncbi:Hypp7233 [Branchiostoma lanceolatum]|uniref:Hypp7233 protein n=1 Tax=Branchiostoma lanceolatum TaxID=7740 RepID=A0A8J9YZ03_BRALA|nr:Hypp7233 [Branchiostoma lanceolatum]